MANLSTLLGGGGLESKPMIWVRDVKNHTVGGGTYGTSISQWRVRDINTIEWNDISGATLTNDGTTTGTVGAVGTQGIVNNPSNGTHNDLSSINLPSGDYKFIYSATHTAVMPGNTDSSFIARLYNKTSAAALLTFPVSQITDTISPYSNSYEGRFTLSATSSISVQSYMHTIGGTLTGVVSDFGRYNSSGSSSTLTVNLDLKIYKL